jgi:non-canonical poly(A) RNA polymerase PAPD5/7
VQEVYDKKVLHRLVGVPPSATVVQDVSRLNSTARSNGSGASAVRSAWEPTDRSRESDGRGVSQKPGDVARGQTQDQEIIDVDADVEESRYGIPPRKRRQPSGTPIEFTTDSDEDSEDEVVVLECNEARGDGVEGRTEGVTEGEVGSRGLGQGRVKINRKREFWASKSGTVTGPGK